MQELTLIELTRLMASALLPWFAGSLIVACGLPELPRGRGFLCLGLGFPVGMTILALSMLSLEWLGYPQSFTVVLAVLAITALLGTAVLIARFRTAPAVKDTPGSQADLFREESVRWQTWFAFALALLISARFLSLLPDILLRPIFPWDAWVTWVYKARVWFETGELISLAPGAEWLTQPASSYVIVGIDHPSFISLILLWPALAVGFWDDSLLGLPWLMCGVSCCLMILGVLRFSGAPLWVALAPVYLFLSLPMVGTHMALVGYADLWMAMFYLMFAAAMFLWLKTRDHRFISFMLVPAAAMIFVKDTGAYWILALIAALFAGLMSARVVMAGMLAAAIATAVLLITGLDPVAWVTSGRFRLDWQEPLPVIGNMLRHMFVWAEWHLLWFLAPAALIASLPPARVHAEIRALLILIVASLLLLVAGVLASRAGQYVVIGTLYSRVLLQIAPVLILFAALAFWHRYSVQDRVQKVVATDGGSETHAR